MATSAYTDNQVFTTPLANVYCNAIITALQERLKPATSVNQIFALTGTAAKIVQNATKEPVKIKFSPHRSLMFIAMRSSRH